MARAAQLLEVLLLTVQAAADEPSPAPQPEPVPAVVPAPPPAPSPPTLSSQECGNRPNWNWGSGGYFLADSGQPSSWCSLCHGRPVTDFNECQTASTHGQALLAEFFAVDTLSPLAEHHGVGPHGCHVEDGKGFALNMNETANSASLVGRSAICAVLPGHQVGQVVGVAPTPAPAPVPQGAHCSDENFDGWQRTHCADPGPSWMSHGCAKYQQAVYQDDVYCQNVHMEKVEQQCDQHEGGGCKNLVDQMEGRTCESYCNDHGLQCVGAWDEQDDNCLVSRDMTCEEVVSGTSDVICECGGTSQARATTTQSPVDTARCKEIVMNYFRCMSPCKHTQRWNEMRGWIGVIRSINADLGHTAQCGEISDHQRDTLRSMGYEPASC